MPPLRTGKRNVPNFIGSNSAKISGVFPYRPSYSETRLINPRFAYRIGLRLRSSTCRCPQTYMTTARRSFIAVVGLFQLEDLAGARLDRILAHIGLEAFSQRNHVAPSCVLYWREGWPLIANCHFGRVNP